MAGHRPLEASILVRIQASEPLNTKRTSDFQKKSDFRFLKAVVLPRPATVGRGFSVRQNPADFGSQTGKF